MRSCLLLRYSFVCKSKLLLLLHSCCTTLWISESLLSDASFRFVISGMMWTQCSKCHCCLLTWQCHPIKPYVTLQVLLLAVFVQAQDLSPGSQLPVMWLRTEPAESSPHIKKRFHTARNLLICFLTNVLSTESSSSWPCRWRQYGFPEVGNYCVRPNMSFSFRKYLHRKVGVVL
jgi:hypothetical protein